MKTATIKKAQVGFNTVYQVWIDGELSETFKTINGLLTFLNIANLVEVCTKVQSLLLQDGELFPEKSLQVRNCVSGKIPRGSFIQKSFRGTRQ